MKWRIHEVREYEVEADDQEDAEAVFEDHGAEVSVEEPVVDKGVIERIYQELPIFDDLVGKRADIVLIDDPKSASREVVRVEVTRVEDDTLVGNGVLPSGELEHDPTMDDPTAIKRRSYNRDEVERVVVL